MAQAFRIDTLAFSKKLRDAGADERLAEAIVEGITSADTSELATKADLAELREATKADLVELREATKADIAAVQEDVAELRAATKEDIAAVKSDVKTLEVQVAARFADLYKQLWVMAAGIVGLTVTLIKLLP